MVEEVVVPSATNADLAEEALKATELGTIPSNPLLKVPALSAAVLKEPAKVFKASSKRTKLLAPSICFTFDPTPVKFVLLVEDEDFFLSGLKL